ncbi:hypothetical protein [Cellulosimicrobium sp. CpK407]|uniref:hypothetical protein n=1 Tax=Cellulosimicrobium sp. CpK407 TaxID=3229847 RepID=UPI003F396ED4
MAITAYPFDDEDTTEAQYSALFRELQDTGVVGAFGDGALRVTADSTGMNVKIAAGSAIVRGHFLSSTVTETRTVDPAESQPRRDIVVARLDPSDNSITLAVVKGTAATNPADPALTKTDAGIYEMELARVTVPAGAVTIAPGNVQDLRPYIGHRVGIWSDATRPTSARWGKVGLNTTTGVWEYWTGAGWTPLAPVVDWDTIQGKPATFPSTWGSVSGKPTSFPSTWGTVSGKPTSFPPSAHTHTAASIPTTGSNVQADIDYIAGRATSAIATAVAANNNANGRALSFAGDANAVRYCAGPTASQYNHQTGSNRFAVWMDDTLQFGRATSSRRYKDHINTWGIDTAAVLSIEPKTFHRKVDDDGVMDYGAIAEDLHDAGLTELVYYDEEGRPDAIRDHLVPWALLAVVRSQHEQIAALAARLDDVEEVRA